MKLGLQAEIHVAFERFKRTCRHHRAKVRVSRCSSVHRVKSELSGARFTPKPTSCEQFVPKAKPCSAGVTAVKTGCLCVMFHIVLG
jgi:hypothetical protein